MTIGFVTAFLLFQSLPAPTEGQWEQVATQPGGISFAVDAASIARTGDDAHVRVRVTRDRPGEDGVKTVILRYTMDCSAREATTEAVDLYGADGTLIGSAPASALSTAPVGDDPGALALFNRACRPAPPAPPAGH
jgi:hypothetical protein